MAKMRPRFKNPNRSRIRKPTPTKTTHFRPTR